MGFYLSSVAVPEQNNGVLNFVMVIGLTPEITRTDFARVSVDMNLMKLL